DEKQNQLKLTILETIQIEKLIHEIRFKIKNFVEKDLKDLKDEIQFKISSSRNSFLTEFESFSSCDFSINQKIKKLNNSLDLAFEDCPDLHLENISPESFIFNLFSDIISINHLVKTYSLENSDSWHDFTLNMSNKYISQQNAFAKTQNDILNDALSVSPLIEQTMSEINDIVKERYPSSHFKIIDAIYIMVN
ncbi:hypothetical protein ROZALSC1DRAFT_21467, partial [Rozella allomycis CSF55]